jgi:taurine dioxygenase
VLVFRDQHLSREQHKAFARIFGDLHVHPSHRSGMGRGDDPELFIIDTPADARQSNGEAWHSDVSCEEVPPMASLLYVTKVPDNGGGDTMFANMYQAYEELSDDLKALLSDKVAFHDGEVDLRSYGIKLLPGQEYPSADHPVIVQHPETGKPILFVNRSFTSHIRGIPLWESRMLLEGLYDFIATNARLHCRVKWTPGTLVMWDNRCVQHQAIRDYAGYARYGERVSVLDGKIPAAYPV